MMGGRLQGGPAFSQAGAGGGGPTEKNPGPAVGGKTTTKESPCLWDADMLVNLREVVPRMEKEKLRAMIDRKFQTGEGKRIAHELYLPDLPAAERM